LLVLPRLDPSDLLQGAHPGYCCQQNWLYAVFSPAVHAYALWGHPEVADLRSLFSFWDSSFGKLAPHAIIADVRSLELVSPGAFAVFLDYFRTRSQALGDMVRDARVVLSGSLAGSVAAGFFGVIPAPFPVSTTTEFAEAAAEFGLSSEDVDAYEAMRRDLQGHGDVVTASRRLLEDSLVDPDSASLAKRLGMSERSMQRKLSERSTSFSDQLSIARIERAKALMETTAEPLTQIAFAVGFGTLEHFSRTFRARVGMAPSAYRASLLLPTPDAKNTRR
jgi:AraC-like DNA-binding protein